MTETNKPKTVNLLLSEASAALAVLSNIGTEHEKAPDLIRRAQAAINGAMEVSSSVRRAAEQALESL